MQLNAASHKPSYPSSFSLKKKLPVSTSDFIKNENENLLNQVMNQLTSADSQINNSFP